MHQQKFRKFIYDKFFSCQTVVLCINRAASKLRFAKSRQACNLTRHRTNVVFKCTCPKATVPIKRVGPNNRVGWIFCVLKFLKQVGPNKQVGWRKKKAVNLKRVGLKKVERVEKVQVGWERSENANRVYSFIWQPLWKTETRGDKLSTK